MKYLGEGSLRAAGKLNTNAKPVKCNGNPWNSVRSSLDCVALGGCSSNLEPPGFLKSRAEKIKKTPLVRAVAF